ncbi:MAG: hypothetical protein EOO83_00560 [Oxalobacteraceae bacterium]|nr:MAG: hypothetical protein EOO83_00560 [Oxalobacteraceae bacterium]
MKQFRFTKATLLITTALAFPGVAQAQKSDASDSVGLDEIVVTAQKRAQSIQDVPIAVTALTPETLQANRVMSVNDLSGLAPGLSVRPSAGGVQIPSFSMRGVVSYGVVAGSDKQISIYVDGVYVGSPRGSIFDLPDIQRIEVLRGPQGTLFGRNATAGAVSITTRDPTGEPSVRAELSVGNYDQYRVRMTADLPQMGPISAYGSFVRNYRRGDIENAGAGTLWDRTAAGLGVKRSPRWLGTADSNSYFAAVKFDAGGDFNMVYKFDHNEDRGTPEGTGFVGHDPNYLGLLGPVIASVINNQPNGRPVYSAPDGKRPKIVDNAWALERDQKVTGHSLTANLQLSDNISLKNVAAYRKAEVFTPSPIDGLSTLIFPQAAVQPFALFSAFSQVPNFSSLPPAVQAGVIAQFAGGLQNFVGSRFGIIASQSGSTSQQWSDELQLNYTSERLTVTAGALWYKQRDRSGAPGGLQNTVQLGFLPASGIVPIQNQGEYRNDATSLAAYAQIEYKITPEFEIVGGARITRDRKTGTFTYGTRPNLTTITPPVYTKTKPNFMVGLNYSPNQDLLVYGKYSTSFVSGGSTAGLVFEPETVESWEAGIKADLFDRRLRANLALFHAKYKHLQSAQGTSSQLGSSLIVALATPLYGAAVANQLPAVLGTFVADQGSVKAQGFELELTAAPVTGVTLGGSLAYTDTSFPFVNPAIIAANGNNPLAVSLRPDWTASTFAQYETQPLIGDAFLSFRIDANWRSRMLLDQNQNRAVPQIAVLKSVDPYWLVNGRVALRKISIGRVEGELAVWGRNLTNNRSATFALVQELASSANYNSARSYGADFMIKF